MHLHDALYQARHDLQFKLVLETTCIKQITALRDQRSDIASILSQQNKTCI